MIHEHFVWSYPIFLTVVIAIVYFDSRFRRKLSLWDKIAFCSITPKNVERRKINVALFEKKQKQNVQFLQYLSGESSYQAQELTTGLNLSQLKSKALFTAVLFKIKKGETLKNLEQHTSAIIILGMKSLIEAFENVCKL